VGALFCGTPWKRTRGTLDDSQRRVPGDDPAWLFEEVHPASVMPRVVDPESGWVQNCNETPWYFTSPVLDQADWPTEIAPRLEQVIDLRVTATHAFFKEHDTVTPEQLLGLKFGKRALLADICLDELLAAADDADLAPAVQVLEAWDRYANADSAGYPLFWVWGMLNGPQLAAGSFFTPVDEPAAIPAGMADPAAGAATLRAAVELLAGLGIPLGASLGQIATAGSDDAGNPVPADGGAQLVGALKCLELLPTPDGPLVWLGDTWVSRIEFRPDGPPIADNLLVYGNTTEPEAPASRSQWPLWAADALR
jgi:acyl-homoserine-lactone acylase